MDILSRITDNEFVITNIRYEEKNGIPTIHLYGYKPIKEIMINITIENGELD